MSRPPTLPAPLSLARPALPASVPTAARLVLQRLAGLAHGTLELQLPGGDRVRFGSGAAPQAVACVHDWRVFSRTLASGDIGFAESYLEGEWSSPDLAGLLRLLVAHREALENAVYGRWWGRALHRLRHLLNRNSHAQARRNVQAHYDLGNSFYRLWLDESMTYSGAWFDGRPGLPIEAAQQAKLRRALRQCGLQPGGRLLEIGCGWGSLAELAAREFGARVTGLTLSLEQWRFAAERLQRQGLEHRVELRLQDWRDLDDGPYDAICSIEMFEAVGREFWERFFAMLRRGLRPGGRACLQTITIREDLFARYVGSTDFIQQYVFPGGLLPSASAFRAGARRAGLQLVDELDFGPDYAETLRRWRERFAAAEPQVRALGFDTRFIRLWRFYLAYCEAAFAERNTAVMQFTLLNPDGTGSGSAGRDTRL
ncbi:cyclopropane-fatty-acyl-phospholipid synthase family protein [Aquabacterium sp. A7-Y]|uniref:SAM-dependent methyltransferase n=1 Tax=Aquabacterium sp. A7-Y TaxID=1349605 RepID=UPI00223C9515|nr:cyclopropane-fatty-acyl-phospholipid synthase family protein [Aquabacterium sp. A7-Y]MCW7536646.1 cyclopropane-fatty-acyl-phospholipid synthase family protein [Aquabacterium sp. A7-Y]